MSRRKPLVLIMEPQLISSGLFPDVHLLRKPLWDIAENVRFYQGKVRRLVPREELFTPAVAPIRGLSQQQSSDGTRWIWAAAGAEVYRWDQGVPELVHTFDDFVLDQTPAAQATFVDMTHWGNWTILNNGFGAPQLYKPGGFLVEDLEQAPVDVVQILKKQNQLMAIGWGDNKRIVSWSDADDIENWTSAPDTLARKLAIEELDTPIRAANKIGQNVSVYAEDQLAIVYWVGAPFYFGQRIALDGIGAVGKAAVCADGRFNYGVSRNGIWKTDSIEAAYIDEGFLSDYLQDNVNWDQASKIVAARNDVKRCIEFHFPMGDSLVNNEGWAFDPQYGGFTQIPPAEFAMERRLFSKPLQGLNDGSIMLVENNILEAAPLRLRTKPLLVAQNGVELRAGALIDKAEFMLHQAFGVQFRYGVAENYEGPWAYSAWQGLYTDQRTYDINMGGQTGVFHVIEFQSVTDLWKFDLQGFALFGMVEGEKREKA